MGNKVVYSYWTDEGSSGKPYTVYPASIDYNCTHVSFYYEKRSLDEEYPDTTDTLITATGNEFSTIRYRLKTIDVTVDGHRAWRNSSTTTAAPASR